MKNGIKIMNLEGADILRSNIEGKKIALNYNAVFSNSKLKNKMDLNINLEKTRDIINLTFNMPVTKIDESKYEKYKEYIKDNKISADNIRKILYLEGFELTFNKEKILKASKKLGTKLITDTENKKYILVDRGGEILKEDFETETIKYKWWFRSSAKARVGECLFVKEELYENIVRWQQMNIELPEGEEGMVVEMLAYMALTASTIENEIEINPENILVVNDLKSKMLTNCAKVVVDKNGQCKVERGLHEVKNTLFDGQALLDDSVFKDTNASMKLLRHHFFKACAFRTYISKFMQDYCKENKLDYNTATVKDKYGNDIKVKDIKMITTENAMKWEKFFKEDKSEGFRRWKDIVNKDGNLFGVCKEDHESKYKDKQKMSYQMINTLPVSRMELSKIAKFSINYINNLKDCNKEFLKYLEENKNITNAYQMMLDLHNVNTDFYKTDLFKDFKTKELCKLKKSLLRGKLLVEGDNLTVVGNPYIMLMHSVGKVKINKEGYIITEDETLPVNEKYISIYTKKFEDKEELVSFRNPHNAPNNIALFKNNRNDLLDKYFNFSNNIMAVNCINTEIQDLANGMDFDSDFMFTTNNENIVEAVKEKVFRKYACIVNCIPQSKKEYINTMENIAIIDNALAKGKNDIGTSSNQAQIAMSLFANSGYKDEELLDCVIILSVLAQVAIDNAKRQYEINLDKEINRLKRLLNNKLKEENKDKDKKAKRPLFFFYTSTNKNTEYKVKYKDKDLKEKTRYFSNKYEAELFKNEKDNAILEEKNRRKNKDSFNKNIKCTMDYLIDIVEENVKNASKGEKIKAVLLIKIEEGKAKQEQCEKIINLVENYDNRVKSFNVEISKMSEVEEREKKKEFRFEEEYLMENIIKEIEKMKITDKTMNKLIKSALDKDSKTSNTHIRIKLLNVLYNAKRDNS